MSNCELCLCIPAFVVVFVGVAFDRSEMWNSFALNFTLSLSF